MSAPDLHLNENSLGVLKQNVKMHGLTNLLLYLRTAEFFSSCILTMFNGSNVGI